MKLLTYTVGSRNRQLLGVLSQDEEWVYPLSSFGMDYKSMSDVVCSLSDSELQLLAHSTSKQPEKIAGAVNVHEITILAPIPQPAQDIICLGINYMAHAEESARFKNESFSGERPYAVYFSKRVNSCLNPNENIPSYPTLVDSLDYECELAVILKKDAKNVSPEDAKDYIFGYTILNDVSARNIQNRHKQWYFGKSLDGFCPMGPWIVTADSFAFPPKLQLQTHVNGELRQNANTSDLIFGLEHIISELSEGMTLKAGTIISTGTPSGVGMGMTPPTFLKSGDVVECKIEGIGVLKNTVE
ncbi:MAG: fumarylacetoacetate hydrolase family protein [bacterium]|nr:fumarylacetoacetate hydrolase family protein [bacterium]